MNKKINKSLDNDVYFMEILKNLHKAKFTIIFFSIFFLSLGIFYSKVTPKKFTTSALIQGLNFDIYKEITGVSENIYADSFDSFLQQVQSPEVFAEFLITNQGPYNDFVNSFFINKENISEWTVGKIILNAKEVYLGVITNNEINTFNNELVFSYPEELEELGPKLLNDYILTTATKVEKNYLYKLRKSLEIKIKRNSFIRDAYIQGVKKEINSEIVLNTALKDAYIQGQKKITNSEIKKLELEKKEFFLFNGREINNKIFNYQQALNVANNLDLKKPQRQNDNDHDRKSDADIIVNFGEERQLYNEGIIVLTTQIKNLNQKLKNLDKHESYNKIVSAIDNKKNLLKNPNFLKEYNEFLKNEIILKKKLENVKESKEYNEFLKKEFFQKKDLEAIMRAEDNIKLAWNPILERAVSSNRVDFNDIYGFVGLILGILISFLFLFFKSLIRKK